VTSVRSLPLETMSPEVDNMQTSAGFAKTKYVKINKQQGHLKVCTTVISLKNDVHYLSRQYAWGNFITIIVCIANEERHIRLGILSLSCRWHVSIIQCINKVSPFSCMGLWKVWRFQRNNQKPYIEKNDYHKKYMANAHICNFKESINFGLIPLNSMSCIIK